MTGGTVYTAAGLDALPVGSVIRTSGVTAQESPDGTAYRPRVAEKVEPGDWFVADEDEMSVASDELDDLPATVLYRPDRPSAVTPSDEDREVLCRANAEAARLYPNDGDPGTEPEEVAADREAFVTGWIAAAKSGPSRPQAAPSEACVCGDPTRLGVVHRADGPCWLPDHNAASVSRADVDRAAVSDAVFESGGGTTHDIVLAVLAALGIEVRDE